MRAGLFAADTARAAQASPNVQTTGEAQMPTLTRSERRENRRLVLMALLDETGSHGGGAAEARVKAYCKAPQTAGTTEFGYVGGLRLRRFYVDPAKPNASERQGLWAAVRQRMGKSTAPVPGGWDGATDVMTLQQLAEETA